MTMREFLIENPATIARTELQRIEKAIIALRTQHEPSDAREEQEEALWAQHAELAKQLPPEPTVEELAQQKVDQELRQLKLNRKVQELREAHPDIDTSKPDQT